MFLDSCGVDKAALMSRIVHSSAHQLFVMGIFNSDPHAGNLLVCPITSTNTTESSDRYRRRYVTQVDDNNEVHITPLKTPKAQCRPGLLDFGMTVR